MTGYFAAQQMDISESTVSRAHSRFRRALQKSTRWQLICPCKAAIAAATKPGSWPGFVAFEPSLVPGRIGGAAASDDIWIY